MLQCDLNVCSVYATGLTNMAVDDTQAVGYGMVENERASFQVIDVAALRLELACVFLSHCVLNPPRLLC